MQPNRTTRDRIGDRPVVDAGWTEIPSQWVGCGPGQPWELRLRCCHIAPSTSRLIDVLIDERLDVAIDAVNSGTMQSRGAPGPPRTTGARSLRRPQRHLERRGGPYRPRDDVLARGKGGHRGRRPLGVDRDPDPQRRPARIHVARRRLGPRARTGGRGQGDAAHRKRDQAG